MNPIRSTIVLSIPLIVLMLMDTASVFGDLYWISRLDMTAVAAMAYIANIIYIVYKRGVGLGNGANVIISNAFGEKNEKIISNVALHGFILIFIVGIVIPALIMPFLNPICEIIGIDIYSDFIQSYLFFPIIFVSH